MSRLAPYPSHGKVFARLACGHFASNGEDCDDCRTEGASPDLWLVAGGDVSPNPQAETRSYRQSKFRQ